MRICSVCRIEKPSEDFYRYKRRCKTCCAKYQAEWVEKHPLGKKEYYRQVRLGRAEKQRAYYKGWYALHGRLRAVNYGELVREWIKSHPGASSAYHKIRYAVKIGKIIRPDRCAKCDIHGKVHAHHDDYRKPLEVRWLCASCHKLLHLNKVSS